MKKIFLCVFILSFFSLSAFAEGGVTVSKKKTIQQSGIDAIVARGEISASVSDALVAAYYDGKEFFAYTLPDVLETFGDEFWLQGNMEGLMDYAIGELTEPIPDTRQWTNTLDPDFKMGITSVGACESNSNPVMCVNHGWALRMYNNSCSLYNYGCSVSYSNRKKYHVFWIDANKERHDQDCYVDCTGNVYMQDYMSPAGNWTEDSYYTEPTEQNVAEFIRSDLGLWQDPDKVVMDIMNEIVTSNTAVVGPGNSIMTPMPGYDPETDTYYDPQTGETLDLTYHQTTEGEKIEIKPLAKEKDPDSAWPEDIIGIPVKSDIKQGVVDYVSNMPLVNTVKAFHVEASSGQCSFSVPVPGGSTGTLNFCNFDFVWAEFHLIIVALAYIYAIMIIFKGG